MRLKWLWACGTCKYKNGSMCKHEEMEVRNFREQTGNDFDPNVDNWHEKAWLEEEGGNMEKEDVWLDVCVHKKSHKLN